MKCVAWMNGFADTCSHAWMPMSNCASMEALVRKAQGMRGSGAISGEDAFFFVYPIIALAERRIDDRTSPALDALIKKIGEHSDEAEEEAGSREFDRIHGEIVAATFDEFGETELGAMYRHGPELVYQRLNRARDQALPRPGAPHRRK